MGTNFYCKHIPTEEEYAQMQEALTSRQLNKLRELLGKSQKKYHIGKRSCGWQFLFSPHIDKKTDKIVSPWENTLESLKAYLSQSNVIIFNEYDETFTPEQFWNEEIGHCLYNDPEKYINCEQYYQEHPNKRYTWEETEFTTKEGLRFATTNDFC